jgi:hypothetical protein
MVKITSSNPRKIAYLKSVYYVMPFHTGKTNLIYLKFLLPTKKTLRE